MNVNTHAKDGTCVYQALGKEQKHRVRDNTGWCYDEARCRECDSCDEHRDCRIDLDVSPSFFGHVVLDYISMVQR